MTLEEMNEIFEANQDKYLDRGDEKLCDLNAFLKLQDLAPVDGDIVSNAQHDVFWVAHDENEVADNATEEDIIFLIRCGVMYEIGMGFSFFT